MTDFDNQTKTVTIEEGQSQACTDVAIQMDDLPEGLESFSVISNIVGDVPGILQGDSVVVVISDVPGKIFVQGTQVSSCRKVQV